MEKSEREIYLEDLLRIGALTILKMESDLARTRQVAQSMKRDTAFLRQLRGNLKRRPKRQKWLPVPLRSLDQRRWREV